VDPYHWIIHPRIRIPLFSDLQDVNKSFFLFSYRRYRYFYIILKKIWLRVIENGSLKTVEMKNFLNFFCLMKDPEIEHCITYRYPVPYCVQALYCAVRCCAVVRIGARLQNGASEFIKKRRFNIYVVFDGCCLNRIS
jgi:hypothetical protein